ncbi:fumarate reductase subunit C [Ectothiorhodospira mobilis]|uniref:fumarate reductase subunit C n=1 Tax=Ectothiorhodospira mobilis TaxID=195064 RepID=UPI001EE8C815|nr:fumarate reductase subunit C [Ectothiorhodospira mobilis]MCG5534687.1 fumarate reductase subunit C [Ectothiorhodospira mobilis]
MTALRTHTRSMKGWWRRHPAYRQYLLREATSVVIGLYALCLLWGMIAVLLGPGAHDVWRACVQSLPGRAFHLLALAAFSWHAWTWFRLLPLTVAPLRLGRYRITQTLVHRAALGAWALASAALLVAAAGGLR